MQIMPFIWISLAIVMAVCEAATGRLNFKTQQYSV